MAFLTSKTKTLDDPKNWFCPNFEHLVKKFEGTLESGQGVKMSEIIPSFDFGMNKIDYIAQKKRNPGISEILG